jgi:hypothetical protein
VEDSDCHSTPVSELPSGRHFARCALASNEFYNDVNLFVGFEVLTEVVVKSSVLWDTTPSGGS